MFNPNDTVLAGLDTATLQAWLAEAQQAYRQLMIGGKPVTVTHEGKSVTYTESNRGDLEQWITLLMRQLGMGRGRRALRPYF